MGAAILVLLVGCIILGTLFGNASTALRDANYQLESANYQAAKVEPLQAEVFRLEEVNDRIASNRDAWMESSFTNRARIDKLLAHSYEIEIQLLEDGYTIRYWMSQVEDLSEELAYLSERIAWWQEHTEMWIGLAEDFANWAHYFSMQIEDVEEGWYTGAVETPQMGITLGS